MTYRIFVDGYCELPEELKNNPNISVIASGKEPEVIKLKKKSVFNKFSVKKSEGLPSVKPEDFRVAFEQTNADMIFVLTVSDKLSDTYTQARFGKSLYTDDNPGAKIRVINSCSFGYGEGQIAKNLVALCESGKKFGEISARITRYLSTLFPVYISPYAQV